MSIAFARTILAGETLGKSTAKIWSIEDVVTKKVAY